jgi:hypothetical protein
LVSVLGTRILLAVAAVVMALSGRVQALTSEQEVEEDQSLSSRLVTPHRPWATGYTGGPVRALFFVDPGGWTGDWFAPETRMREVVELGQRVDLQADAVFFGGSTGADFLGLEIGRRRAERLLARPYQVYVFANARFDRLPPHFQFLIMEQVAQGAGLLCCGPAPTEFLAEDRRLAAPVRWLMDGLPELDGKAPGEILRAYRLGAGRGVWLDYPAYALTPRGEFSYKALAEYDYRLLWVVRCLLWAASREGAVSVCFRPRVQGGPVPQRPSWVIELGRSEAVPARLHVDVTVRRRGDGWVLALDEESVWVYTDRPGALPVNLPPLRAGAYVLDAVVRSRRGVEGFAATTFDIASPFGIAALLLDQSFAERGQRLTGSVALRGAAPPGTRLRLLYRDAFERVLHQVDLPVPVVENARVPFEYVPGAHDTIGMRCEALILFGEADVDGRVAEFTVPDRRRGRFNFLQWDTPTDVLGVYAWQQMRRAGMNLCLLGSFSETKAVPALAASDTAVVPYVTRILDPKDAEGVMQVRSEDGGNMTLCWNDEPAIDEYVRRLVGHQLKRREHGVFAYSLGDEGVTMGCCVHPKCLAAYRRYLESQYGTIGQLNASWGSDYTAFAEVDLLDRKDNLEEAAKAKGQYARWFDRQAFARWNLAHFAGRFGKAFETLDPEAVTGFEGTGGFGDDLDAILGTNGFYSPYPGIGDDIIRSAAPRHLIRANWMGYSKTGDALADAAWRMVMRGMDSVWFWMWTGVGSYRGYLSPTLDLYPATADLAEEMRPVRQGLGDLLLQSQPVHSGIAVLYSLPSALAHWLDEGSGYVGPEATHQTWTRLTSELGLDFRYLTQAMLRQGALRPDEFRVLLLPMAQAVGPDEAAAILAFVEAGGTVVADVRPGLFDAHCKPVDPGTLDGLFGIRRTRRSGPHCKPLGLNARLGGEALVLETPRSRLDPGIEAVNAEVLGKVEGVPVLLVNTVGRGRAILLNFQVLSDQADESQRVAALAFLRGLYDAVRVVAAVAVTSPQDEPLPFTETHVWRTGDALVFGLYRQMQCAWFAPTSGTVAGAPVRARVTLPEARYVYDLRRGRLLGRVTQFDTDLRWGRASFFLAVPERIGAIEVQLNASKPAAGTVIQAEIDIGGVGQSGARQALFAEVLDPSGQPTAWGGRAVVLTNGHGSIEIPVAHNADRGRWRLRVTELFSREAAEAVWTIR